MTSQTRVVVCGSSLYMASLAAGLKATSALDVERILTVSPALPEYLRDLGPAAVAIDLGEAPAELLVALLRQCPGLLLLGVDPTSNDFLVLAGGTANALSVADLVNIIEDRTPSSEPPRRRTS